MTNQPTFYDFYATGVSFPKLTTGKYQARLITDTFVTPAKENDKPYVRCDWRLGDRTVCDNRFEAGFRILVAQAREVLNLGEERVPVHQVIAKLKQQDVDFYVKEVTLDDGRIVMNYSLKPFLEPATSGEGPFA